MKLSACRATPLLLYALSRSALRTALAEQAPSPNERRLLDSVTKRVRLWKEVEPFYKDADRGHPSRSSRAERNPFSTH